MQLKKGEGELQSGKATIKEFIVGGKNSEEMLSDLEGTLYLTNYRFVMEKEVSSEEPTVIFQFPLKALQNAKTKGVFGKTLRVEADLSQMSTGAKERRLELQKGHAWFSIKTHDLQAWVGQLSKAIQHQKAEM